MEEEGDESGLYVRSGFLLLAAAVASFEFTNLAGVPWYKQAFEHAEELLEGGVNLRQLTDSLLDEFHSFDDTTFLLETEKQLNSILRALEQVQQQIDERRRQMGTVLREEPDMANFARNTARMVRHETLTEDPGDAEHMRGKGGWQPRFRNCILHEQKRKHGGKSFRNFGPEVLPYAEELLRPVWDMSAEAPTERQTAEITAAALASRVASEVGAMWTSSAYTGGGFVFNSNRSGSFGDGDPNCKKT